VRGLSVSCECSWRNKEFYLLILPSPEQAEPHPLCSVLLIFTKHKQRPPNTRPCSCQIFFNPLCPTHALLLLTNKKESQINKSSITITMTIYKHKYIFNIVLDVRRETDGLSALYAFHQLSLLRSFGRS
jgi:hypothetical protein